MLRARRRLEAATTATAPAVALRHPWLTRRPTLKWRAARRRWAALLCRIHEADPLVCLRCAGPMRIVAIITGPRVIHKNLHHLATKGADRRSPPQGGAAAA